MTGLSDRREAAILDTTFGVDPLYLRLLTGAAGQTVNDDGTFPSGCAELSTGGYAPLAVPAAAWNAAVGGSPSAKSVPNVVNSPLSFTPTGVGWDLCGYCWTTDSAAITSANLESSGVFSDISGTPIVRHVSAGQPFEITNLVPITERLGDPPAGVNPT